jgi:prefoldin subunit 5
MQEYRQLEERIQPYIKLLADNAERDSIETLLDPKGSSKHRLTEEEFSLLNKDRDLKFNQHSRRLETVVNIGQNVFVQAAVPLRNIYQNLYVHIGFGFHAEVPVSELPPLITERIRILKCKSELLHDEIAGVSNDLEQVSLIWLLNTTCPYFHLLPSRPVTCTLA